MADRTNHTRHRIPRLSLMAGGAIASVALFVPSTAAHADRDDGARVTQTNLVANTTGYGAGVVDANLVNAWGMSKFPASPVWVSNNHTDTSTLYAGGTAAAPGDVKIRPLVVTVPDGPTGQIANAMPGLLLANDKPALFVFANEAGAIYGWNQGSATTAEKKGAVPDANFKGLAQAASNGSSYLFAANFAGGEIDVFDSSWHQVSWPGMFRVRRLPEGFAPFNVQALTDDSGSTHVFVAYAKRNPATGDEIAGRGLGLVAEFTTAGQFVRRFEREGMNAPWGLALAPSSFGAHVGELMVGQFGNGRIELYDTRDGDHTGTVRDANGHKLVIDGLWGLMRGDATAGGVGSVLFTAGPNGENDGLYGVLTPTFGHASED